MPTDHYLTRKGWSFQSSFTDHHPAIVAGLLGELLRPGHLQHLPQEVKGQVHGDGRVVGALLLLLLPPAELQLQGAVGVLRLGVQAAVQLDGEALAEPEEEGGQRWASEESVRRRRGSARAPRGSPALTGGQQQSSMLSCIPADGRVEGGVTRTHQRN